MSSITLRDLPREIEEKLAREARASGEDLEAYLHRVLIERAGGQEGSSWPDLVDRFVAEVAVLPLSEPPENDDFMKGVREDRPRWIPDFDTFAADGSDNHRD